MKTKRLTAAAGFGLGALLLTSCVYDRASDRATRTTWDTRDDGGEPMDERQASINEETSPFVGAARPASAGGPGADDRAIERAEREERRTTSRTDERVSERVDPRTKERVVIIEDAERVTVRVRGPRTGATERRTETNAAETTARAEERAPDAEGDAPLVEEATPEAPRVADETLREIADEGRAGEPLIVEGILREDACPTELEGARVALVERPEGPTLVFQTSEASDVEELQSRVMALALTKDDERVEYGEGTSAALEEGGDGELVPTVRPPSQTGVQEGAESDMPFNLPTALTAAEQQPSATVAERLTPLPEAEVTVELKDDGAEVLFEPAVEGQRGALTRQLELRARTLQEGDCPADTMSMVTSSR